MIGKRTIIAGIIACVLAIHPNAYSATSTIGQTVEPITCVYTVTEAGDTTSSSTACDSVAPATLELVQPRGGKPLLGGTVIDSGLASFRVWIGGVWFTSGVSSSLTVINGAWTLDLSSLSMPLTAGNYTIVLEERTTDDLLLRSIYENALTIPVIKIIRTDTSDGEGITSDFVTESDRPIAELLAELNYPEFVNPVPDAQLLESARGMGFYTVDTAQSQTGGPELTRLAFGFGTAIAAGYGLYLGGRTLWMRYKR